LNWRYEIVVLAESGIVSENGGAAFFDKIWLLV